MTASDAATDSAVVELVTDSEDPIERTMDEDLRLLEALLFASASAVTERAIAERLGDDADIPALLEQLKAQYKGRGVELTRAGNRWFFRTAPDLGDRMKLEKIVPRKLSRAGVETLAIVAYHQPVTRAEIEEIRGVVISRGTLDILLEEGWIKPKGKRQTPGRPTTWGTTDSFLDHFGLESLNDLPGVEELKAAGLLDPRKGVAAYTARAEEGESLLFDTDENEESEDAIEPLSEDDSPNISEGDAEALDAEETRQSAEDAPIEDGTDASIEQSAESVADEADVGPEEGSEPSSAPEDDQIASSEDFASDEFSSVIDEEADSESPEPNADISSIPAEDGDENR